MIFFYITNTPKQWLKTLAVEWLTIVWIDKLGKARLAWLASLPPVLWAGLMLVFAVCVLGAGGCPGPNSRDWQVPEGSPPCDHSRGLARASSSDSRVPRG